MTYPCFSKCSHVNPVTGDGMSTYSKSRCDKFSGEFCHDILPSCFQENFIQRMISRRHSNHLIFPRFRHEYARRMLRYSIVKTINDCPPNILEKVLTHSQEGLALYTKNHILSEYESRCSLANCYICSRNERSWDWCNAISMELLLCHSTWFQRPSAVCHWSSGDMQDKNHWDYSSWVGGDPGPSFRRLLLPHVIALV